jgi:hypothetical protein
MEAALRAGVAIYNAGEFHAAHDAWEEPWLGLDKGTTDERLLHGLIQFTAAIHHATEGNTEGATGLAESARAYLRELDGHRGANTEEVREFLESLASDPGVVANRAPPKLTLDGAALTLEAIEFEAGVIAARVLAEEHGYEANVIERASEFARRDLTKNRETSPFVTLVLAFARSEDGRAVVMDRLRGHVERREAREADLEGLFGRGADERADGG